ncbi:MAG: ABC transporter permease, partial [Dehalococcoidia bacterium]
MIAPGARAFVRNQSQRNVGPLSVGALLRFGTALIIAMLVFAAIILSDGTNPLSTLQLMWDASAGTEFGRTEVLVKVIPFGLCALAVAIPARVGLINVGGEG